MPTLAHRLDKLDSQYDPEARLLRQPLYSVGYHTNLPEGMLVHPTRESLGYALLLLETRQPESQQRAREILDVVLELQKSDPASPYFGVWPWFAEESLEEMDAVDFNWADFLGARLCMMLARHKEALGPDLAKRARLALDRAARSIIRRNVAASYTNIAIMGSGVTVIAGELLGRPDWIDNGRQRLGAVLESVAQHGGFAEYNSPTYSLIAMEELERILDAARDEVTRQRAMELLGVTWNMLADIWHPPTQQLAGPQARAYSDRLGNSTRHRLLSGAGLVPPNPDEYHESQPWPCPPELRQRFGELPSVPHEFKRSLMHYPDGSRKWGITWLDDVATIGSASQDPLWHQRRALLAYWRTDENAGPSVEPMPAVLRLRMLRDGRDFPVVSVVQQQVGPRVLGAAHFSTGAGPFNPVFGVPADGLYPASDLRLRVSLEAPGATVCALDGNRFELKAGLRKIVLHVADGCTFNGHPIRWQASQEEGLAIVDAVMQEGVERPLKPADDELRLAWAVELLPVYEESTLPPPSLTDAGEALQISWAAPGFTDLTCPARGIPFQW